MAEEAKPTDLSALWGPSEARSSPSEELPSKEPIPVPETEEGLPEEKHEKHEEKIEQKLEKKIIEGEAEIAKEGRNFGEKFDELLAELNLTRKHLYGFVVGIIVILFIVFFGIRFITEFLEKRKEEKPKIEMQREEITSEKTAIPKELKLHPSIKASLSLSHPVLLPPYLFPKTGLELSLLLGKTFERKDLVSTSLIHLKRMRNAFSTDVNQLLSKSVNREGVLQNHLTLLRHLAEEAHVVVTKLDSELANLEPELKAFTEQREATEQAFFADIESFDPSASQKLDDFIDQSKNFVEIRSRVRALTEIRNRYTQAIPRLLARIIDIELNSEALVKGIAVYDVKGSDLELILPAEGGSGVPEGAEQPPAVKPLRAPIDTITHPLLQEQKDFITKPGGGL